jgi:lysophospholipase L1-like esterase
MFKKFCFATILFAAGFVLIAAALEIGIRFVLPANPFDTRLDLRPNIRQVHRVDLRGVAPVSHYSTNRWGMRGAEPPASLQGYVSVITVGGSTTQCYYLDDRSTWPAQLEALLAERHGRVWVGNGGIDGHSSRGHRIFADAVIPRVQPTLAVFLLGVNDLGLSLQNETPPAAPSGLLAKSRLFQVIYLWKRVLIDKVVVVGRTDHVTAAPVPLVQESPLPADLRTLLPSLPDFRKNINAIIACCRQNNVQTLFLTQPMLYDDTPYWRGMLGSMYWVRRSSRQYSAATYWNMMRIFNAELIAVCRENNVPCYDLAADIPHSPLYFYDIVHFTDEGARLVAQRISAYIFANRLVRP